MITKRHVSLLLLILTVAAIGLSLVSCGDELKGFSVDVYNENISYSEQTNSSNVEIEVFVTSDNTSHVIRSYKYKVIFKDASGYAVDSRVYTHPEGIEPGSSNSFRYSYTGGNAISGRIVRVEVMPLEMVMENEEVPETSGSQSGSPKWGFWAWFWVILCIILVLVFFLGCVGAEWESSAVIGGIVVCIIPAILILVIYFGFVFGH